MNESDVCIRQVDVNPPVVKLHMTGNTTRRYLMTKIHEYVNQKPASLVDLAKFENMVDKDHWFSKTGRKPTLRILAEEYVRAMNTDLECPITILKGTFLPDGTGSPYGAWVLLDGTHRLVKCLVTGRDKVKVVEVTADELLMHVAQIDRESLRSL